MSVKAGLERYLEGEAVWDDGICGPHEGSSVLNCMSLWFLSEGAAEKQTE